jgi:hypothetical protein
LLDGETRRARVRAEQALEVWKPYAYAGGMARSAAAIALSLRMDGRLEDALEPAILAASLAPYERCFKGSGVVQLAQDVSEDVRSCASCGRHSALIAQLRERAAERRGYFAYLDAAMPDRMPGAMAVLAGLR